MRGGRGSIKALGEALQSLGLTALEADVYACLLGLGQATGYRVGRELGRPTANVYKALDALTAKGAVLLREGGEGLFIPVPPERFLAQLRDSFDRSEEAVLAGVRHLQVEAEPGGIFALSTSEQVGERLQAMIESAQRVVLVDAAPAPLRTWAGALATAAGRGVRVLIKAYGPAAVEGAEVAVDPAGENIRRRWVVDWLQVVVDGSELLLSAQLDGQLLRAVWTREPFVTVVYHEALAGEITLARMSALVQGNASRDALRKTLARSLDSIRLDAVGFERLRRQLRVNDRDSARAPARGRAREAP
jgi:sugar-specific transcriptional regulator TrmB